MNTRSFLQRALADSGSYCIWAHNKKNERIQQKFYQTIDQVIDKADELDTEGYDCYFALATFKEATSRKVTNVHKLQSFFLDIDCGDIKAEEDKGYATQEEALVALQGFCKTLKLPMPVLINSGRGVHVHWQLSEPVVFDDWYPVAARLKAMTKVL